MNQAIDYIENNLSDEIDYSIAAQYVNCSAWEFQRVFSFMTQIPLSEYIRRRRLTLAAHDIQKGKEKVIDVAMRYGYDSPAAFSRAFSQLHGTTPKSARNNGVTLKVFPRLTFKFILEGADEMEFKIEKKEAFDVIGFKRKTTMENNRHYLDIGQFWSDFFNRNMWDTLIKYSENPNEKYSYAVSSYDDNDNTKNEFYYTIGVPYNGKKYSEDLEIIHIPAGSYAVFAMPPDEEVGHFMGRIFKEWLPASRYRLTGGPELELSSSKTDIIAWLPIKE
jgi:AraC family transcriptional regulator